MIEAAEEDSAVDGMCCGIGVAFLVLGRLEARFERVERVDYEIDCECCDCAGDPDFPIGVRRHGMKMNERMSR